MNLSDELIKQLEQGMYGYNPTVYDLMGKVSQSLTAVGVALAVFFFWFDFEVQARAFEEAGTTPDMTSYSKLAMKYVMTVVVIMNSGMILNFILWIAIQITKWVSSITVNSKSFELQSAVKAYTGHKFIMTAMMYVSDWLGNITMLFASAIAKIVLLLRFIELYIYKAFAPILLAFFAQKDLRGNAIQFLKRFAAISLQSAVIVLVSILYNELVTSKILEVTSKNDDWSALGVAVSGILYGVLLVMLLLGSQKKAKEFLDR